MSEPSILYILFDCDCLHRSYRRRKEYEIGLLRRNRGGLLSNEEATSVTSVPCREIRILLRKSDEITEKGTSFHTLDRRYVYSYISLAFSPFFSYSILRFHIAI